MVDWLRLFVRNCYIRISGLLKTITDCIVVHRQWTTRKYLRRLMSVFFLLFSHNIWGNEKRQLYFSSKLFFGFDSKNEKMRLPQKAQCCLVERRSRFALSSNSEDLNKELISHIYYSHPLKDYNESYFYIKINYCTTIIKTIISLCPLL